MEHKDIKYIVVHCSATPASLDIGASDIDEWHKNKGWSSIGYHLVIRRDGTVEHARPYNVAGAHVRGYNDKSWGICLVGGLDSKRKPENNFTEAQLNNLRKVLNSLKVMAPETEILGHRDLSPDLNKDGKITKDEWLKDCPCFDVREWYGRRTKSG